MCEEQIMLNPEFKKVNYPKDFNIQEIADKTEIHQKTVSIYVKVLVAEKKLKLLVQWGK